MHWNFGNYASAWTTATGNDRLYNDATWNVVYVDSHDYGPDSDNRYNGDMRITIGSDMRFGDTKTIQWEAKGMQDGEEETTNGEATYKKVDPNSMITIYVHTTSTASPKLYAWTTTNGTTTELNGAWPGKVLTNKQFATIFGINSLIVAS